MLLSLIIPAYNEAGRIGPSVEKAFRYFETVSYDAEIIVVDDGSSDDTAAAVREAFDRKPSDLTRITTRYLPQPRNMGKGAAVRRGMLEAHGKIRIFTDADFSTPVQEVAKIIPLIDSGEYDVVIGSRAAEGRALVKKHQPWYREAMGRFYNVLVQLFVFRGIRDTQCGFKGFNEHAAAILFSKQKVDGFSFDVEILYLARRYGYRIREIAIEWYNDERSTVGAVSDSARMFWELLRIRKLHRHDR
ncbi:MAG TPA: dolichyl-phosphate beta-glucosyltransferase [Candidatus Kapabacteria bacterium]|nr:dolichyl-phosphate beta-glucosyltransferase [Candidatus Kapabacteria bacterium]